MNKLHPRRVNYFSLFSTTFLLHNVYNKEYANIKEFLHTQGSILYFSIISVVLILKWMHWKVLTSGLNLRRETTKNLQLLSTFSKTEQSWIKLFTSVSRNEGSFDLSCFAEIISKPESKMYKHLFIFH